MAVFQGLLLSMSTLKLTQTEAPFLPFLAFGSVHSCNIARTALHSCVRAEQILAEILPVILTVKVDRLNVDSSLILHEGFGKTVVRSNPMSRDNFALGTDKAIRGNVLVSRLLGWIQRSDTSEPCLRIGYQISQGVPKEFSPIIIRQPRHVVKHGNCLHYRAEVKHWWVV